MRAAGEHPEILVEALRHPLGPAKDWTSKITVGLGGPLFAAVGAADAWIEKAGEKQELLNPAEDPLALAMKRAGRRLVWRRILTTPIGWLGSVLLLACVPVVVISLPLFLLAAFAFRKEILAPARTSGSDSFWPGEAATDFDVGLLEVCVAIPLLLVCLVLLAPLAVLECAAESADLSWEFPAPSAQERLDALIMADGIPSRHH